MKKSLFFIIGCLLAVAVSAQSFKTIEKEFKYIRLPLKMLPGTAKTFNYEFNPGKINWSAYPYDEASVYSFVRLEGYQYQKTNSDVTISVIFDGMGSGDYTIKSDGDGPDLRYTAVYHVAIPTIIRITDSGNKVLDEVKINQNIEVVYPPANDQYGMPIPNIKTEQVLTENLSKKADAINAYVCDVAINKVFNNIKSTVSESYSFVPVVKKYEIMSFKTKKDADYSAWESNALKLAEAFDKLSAGASPQEFGMLVEGSVNFWKSELAKYQSNTKENKQLVGAAAYNIVLASIFANKFDVVSDMSGKFKDHNWKYDDEFGKLIDQANSIKKRVDANTDKAIDYKALGQVLPLKLNQIEAELTPKGGKPMKGVIEYGDPFYVKPYQNSLGITFIPRDQFLSSFGILKGKEKKTYKFDEVEGYKVVDKQFVGVEYSDPTTLSLSGNKALAEVIVSGGKAKLYKMYEKPADAGTQVIGVSAGDAVYKTNMDSRSNPTYIVYNGKKSVVVFNYTAFANLLKDCQTVVDKINKGEYGNTPIEQKGGKVAKFLAKSQTEKIDLKVIVAALTEYNSLMK